MLKLNNIKKDYIAGTTVVHALNGVTLDFRKSEFVTILGPSGCGKTTLMNIIGGLDQMTSGDLTINGVSTKSYTSSDWDNYRNKKVGFVFQNYYLIPHLSILANVELALTLAGISKAERTRLAKDALIKVGLEDQIGKQPNQLSGGQMQRVAIARALVNSPDIVLADEPTGALDSKTSEQIMELIKEISKEKLIIMVTHNPELSERYATRVIRMVDGVITEDNAPYESDEDEVFQAELTQIAAEKAAPKARKIGKNKSSMSFFTATMLSLKNLMSKKGRTILTSIAGSIGIIGIALILAISSGMNAYISKMQTDTLAGNPITISTSSINFSMVMSLNNNETTYEKYPALEKIYAEAQYDYSKLFSKNNITDEYVTYVYENLKKEWYSDIITDTGISLNVYSNIADSSKYVSVSTSKWQQMLNGDFLSTQYDIIAGEKMPSSENEIALIVDEYNKISEDYLIALGFKEAEDGITDYSFDEIIGSELKIVTNNELYSYINDSKFVKNSPQEIDFSTVKTLKITAILRVNKESDMTAMSTGVIYTKALYNWLIDQNNDSEIVNWMNANPTMDPIEGDDYTDIFTQNGVATKEAQREDDFRSLGGNTTPNSINIYPSNYESKALIKEVLDRYNQGKNEDSAITYTDMAEVITSMLSRMVDIITYVLIGFTAISLLVSSVMIAIITYVSVIERTKEIGILRSIGARKRDVSSVFNAETVIIGFFSGLIGVIVAYILSIPINIIIGGLTGVAGIASLKITDALILIAISVALMLISGLIPSATAAKKDPVTALRTD